MKKEKKLDANGKRKFGILDSVSYAAGDLGCNMSFALKSTMALFWTQIMGLGLWYSLLLVVVQVWDAINDPLIGTIIDSDRRKYKRNKFLAYIWFGSIGLIIGGACCFLPFPSAPLAAKIAIFIGGYVIWDAFYTIANVPYGSLLSLISNDPADRASLSAWRSIGSMVGNMLPMVILPFIIYNEDESLNGPRVFLAALIMGVLGFICFQFMIRTTEIRVEEDIKTTEEQPKFNVFVAMKNFIMKKIQSSVHPDDDMHYEKMGLKRTSVEIWEDAMRTDGSRGTYEWWYYDSHFPDGTVMVIIFFSKSPIDVSRPIKPQATLEITLPDGTKLSDEVHATLENSFYSTEKCDVRIGKSKIVGDLNHYDIVFCGKKIKARVSLDGTIPSWRSQTGSIFFGDKEEKYFALYQ